MPQKIIIFDTTLRDGEQSPGATLNPHEKLEIAKQLKKLNVDVIEAGIPISSPGDFKAVKTIAKQVKGPIIAGLARVLPEDIDACGEAFKGAENTRIHTYVSTSDIHIERQLRKTREEVLEMAVQAVKRAKNYVEDVEFSPMDATRSDPKYLYQVLEAVIKAGATVVNIPDTVGYAMPWEFGQLIHNIRENVHNIDKVTISIHCHDDLGLAVANSIAAIQNGATQVECTINGIGERAGNASLEEIVMAIYTRKDLFDKYTDIKTNELVPTSRLVSSLTGIPVQPNKAVVGANAFAHSSGVHADGILKDRRTFEIMRPEIVGVSESKIVLTSRSGRHALRHKLSELGYELTDEQLDTAYRRFLEVADRKKEIFDEDLRALIQDEIAKAPETYQLKYIHTTSGSNTVPTATVRIKKGKQTIQDAATGDGPVDAAYNAIDRITGIKVELLDYSLRSVTKGKDAVGEATVRIKSDQQVVVGRGTSTDIVEASVRAYVNALNRLVYAKGE